MTEFRRVSLRSLEFVVRRKGAAQKGFSVSAGAVRCWVVVVLKERRRLDAKAAGQLADVVEFERAGFWTFLREQEEPAMVEAVAVRAGGFEVDRGDGVPTVIGGGDWVHGGRRCRAA